MTSSSTLSGIAVILVSVTLVSDFLSNLNAALSVQLAPSQYRNIAAGDRDPSLGSSYQPWGHAEDPASSSGPTACKPLPTDLSRLEFNLSPKAGAPLSTLYESRPPYVLGGPPRATWSISIGGGETLFGYLSCDTTNSFSVQADGTLYCRAGAQVRAGTNPPYRAATSAEWQLVINSGLYDRAGINKLLP